MCLCTAGAPVVRSLQIYNVDSRCPAVHLARPWLGQGAQRVALALALQGGLWPVGVLPRRQRRPVARPRQHLLRFRELEPCESPIVLSIRPTDPRPTSLS